MDVTSQIIEAQNARARMQDAKKIIKGEVQRKYAEIIAREVAERTQDAEVAFARVLAKVNAEGVSQALLRREVLRTNVWSVWTYWRDLAGIEAERVTARNEKAAKALANSPFRWADDFATLTVLRTSAGDTLAEPIIYDMTTNRKVQGNWWWPDPTTPENEVAERAAHTLDSGFKAHVSAEIQRQIDAGNIPGED